MDMEKLNSIETLPLNLAKEVAIGLISPKTKPVVLFRLKQDISKAFSSREVLRIMWNTYMAGTGYKVPTSAWQKRYNGC